MLNHIWLALIIIGILTAAGRDIYDVSNNTYGNGIPWEVRNDEDLELAPGGKYQLRLHVSPEELNRHFRGETFTEGTSFDARITMQSSWRGTVVLTVNDAHPDRFAAMRDAGGDEMQLRGSIATVTKDGHRAWLLTFDDVSLIYLKRVTKAAFDIAGVAVQIAIGLIGIMALWLGIMRVAEQAGLIRVLARAVRPITLRLFPDVPPDHPAVGSMLMNISANMLGLGNAATPFGLKAMEELNSINPKSGVATDAMVTFLALNTSCITLIPATAIAVRAALGSPDPAIIIGTSFLASLTATISAVTIARLLSRLRAFRWDRAEAE
jgi:spore maturation protein A